MEIEFTSGRSTVGKFRMESLLSWRSTPRSGCANVGNRNGDQQAAYAVAAWLHHADGDGSLVRFFHPPLDPNEQSVAQVEGWILGVT